ncbi:hypothetical protein ACH5RR_007744 [Cinchona calisaya]|uniref:Response regulatory domain-containing protein n=1 Tax=Cinchona calisaya TaxID=153742 RepID=A0ABD3AD64_9GENT
MNRGKNIVMSESGFGDNGARNYSPTDRSKVRILLCDSNAESCNETFSLLCQCSYQVTSALSDTKIVDALKSDGPHTDIILADVNLLMANDAQMLRYIVHHKDLQHIPVIILTTRDQLSITKYGLRLGAADYLVKPLQDEEISGLWMHMQKRRNEALEGCCSRIKGINI